MGENQFPPIGISSAYLVYEGIANDPGANFDRRPSLRSSGGTWVINSFFLPKTHDWKVETWALSHCVCLVTTQRLIWYEWSGDLDLKSNVLSRSSRMSKTIWPRSVILTFRDLWRLNYCGQRAQTWKSRGTSYFWDASFSKGMQPAV